MPDDRKRTARDVRRWAVAVLAMVAAAGAAEAREPLGLRPSRPPSLTEEPSFAGPGRPFHIDRDGGALRPGYPDPGRLPPPRPGRSPAVAGEAYTYADLLALGLPELVTTLRLISYGQITDLFQYSEAARQFYDDDPRMNALFEALRESGLTYTADDERGIETLGEVIRAGFFLAFYYPELARLNTWKYHLRCLPALEAIAANPAFGWGTETQTRVLASFGLIMADGLTSVGLIDRVRSVLRQFNDQGAAWLRDPNGWNRRLALYYLAVGVDFGIWYGIEYGYGGHPEESPFYGQLGGYVGEMARLALFGQLEPEQEWLIGNAAFWLRQLGRVAPGPGLNLVLTQVIANYGRWTRPSLEAVQGIVEHYGGVDADGAAYDLEQVRRELREQVLPRRQAFEDGAVVFETGPHVDPVKVRRLYWAMKEVKAQFHREIGQDAVLEPGRADDRLTAVIFDSPSDYAHNYFLSGVPTDNGGIYIEQWGTLFTYDRTPADSLYSLEELLRHEYAHYLQGRFLVFGPWGAPPLYDHERLTWFEEGQAEWLAGSTRTQGVRLRRALARQIGDDGPDRWMRLGDVLHAGYGGFTFYRYAMAVFGYLRAAHPERYAQLVERLLARDGAGFDLAIETMSADAGLEAGYRGYLQAAAAGASTAVDPATAPDYLFDPLGGRGLVTITHDLAETAGLQGAAATVVGSSDVPMVVVEGTVSGGPSAGAVEDGRRLEALVQDAQRALEARGWPGYRTFTGHFVDHRLVGDRYQYRVAFTGKLGSRGPCSSALSETSASLAPAGGTGEVGVTTDTNGCLWSAVSTAPWLAVTAGEMGAGSGSVTYQAEPNEGPSRTASLRVAGGALAVSQAAAPEGLTETEPNGGFFQANGPVASGTVVTGTLPHAEDDYFYFDVAAPGPVRIVLLPDARGSYWVLVHESSPGETVGGAVEEADGRITGRFDVRLAGRYYLIVYRWGGAVTSYRLLATYPNAGDCRYAVGGESASVPAGGGALTVAVTQVMNGCHGWTASSHTPWIVVTGGASGTGSGTVQLSIPANRVAARTGTVTIAGRTFTVTQPPPAASRPVQGKTTRQ